MKKNIKNKIREAEEIRKEFDFNIKVEELEKDLEDFLDENLDEFLDEE